MILTVCLNPTLQRTLILESLKISEVNRCSNYRLDASGKGVNVTRVLVQLGFKAIHLTHGDGVFLPLFKNLLEKDNIEAKIVSSGSEIRFCTTIISLKERTVTELVEEAKPVLSSTEEYIINQFNELIKSTEALVISGTKAPGYSKRLFPFMVSEAKKRKILTVLDIRGEDLILSLNERPDIIKPNFIEFVHTFFTEEKISNNENFKTPEIEDKVKKKMLEIFKRFGTRTVLSSGSDSVLFCENSEIYSIMPRQVEVINTIGCGDALTAGITARLLQNKNLSDAVMYGIDCSACNAACIRPGVIRP